MVFRQFFPTHFNELECLSGESGARSLLNSKITRFLGIEIEGMQQIQILLMRKSL